MKTGQFIFLCMGCLMGAGLGAQVCGVPVGAEAAGLGGQSVVGMQAFGVQNNPASLAFKTHVEGGLYNEVRYRQAALVTNALAIVRPGRRLHCGFGLVEQGSDKFMQQRYTLGVARLLSRQVALGMSLDFLGTHIAEQAYKGNITGAVALYVKPGARLDVACFVFNPVRVKYHFERPEDVPSFVRVGFNYRFASQLHFMGEYEHGAGYTHTMRLGLAYLPFETLGFYSGWAGTPLNISFGSAFTFKQVRLTLAASRHEVLGITPHFSCIYTTAK